MGTTRPRSNKIHVRRKVSIPPPPPPGRGPAPRRFAENIAVPMARPSPPSMPPTRTDQITAVTPENPRKAAQPPMRRAGLLLAAATALRKQSIQARATPPPAVLPMLPPEDPWVHVSNLDPEAIREDLEEHFERCGGLRSVEIRYSSSGIPERTQYGYRYAIVNFNEAAQADAALELHGTKLMGSEYQLVVTPQLLALPQVQKLPEFRQIARERPALVKGLPLYHPEIAAAPAPAGNTLQTASGVTVNSPVVKTNVWMPPRRVSARKTKGKKGKILIVGGVQYTRP